MKILLAGPDFEENLSIRYLSASLQSAGHDTVLAVFNSPIDTAAVVNAAQCADVIGLSMCFQARAKEFLGLAQRLKSCYPEKVVVAGGHYASCAAEELLAHHPEIDIVVIHEGERTLVEIADAMLHLEERLPGIAGIAYRNGGQVCVTAPRPMAGNLDELPVPDRRGPVHMIAGVPTSYLMGSRGCYENCAYCCITTLHRLAPGKRFRQRSVEGIADEMAALYEERGTRQFIFHDDNFLVPSEAMNHTRISAFEKALKRRGLENIALVVKCRPADANRNVLERLKALGLVRVFLGVESATAQGLAVLERKQSVGDSERALAMCAELGISAQFTLMIFHPGSTVETLRSDVAFMRRFGGNPLNFGRTEIYAGTPLEKRMMECGRASGDYLARAYRLLDPAAELACNTSLSLFRKRCWSNGSVMQTAIGLDHSAAVVKRFYTGARSDALARRVAAWVCAVNIDTINLLEEVIELSAATCSNGGGRVDARFRRGVRAIAERESSSCAAFLAEGRQLSVDLQGLHLRYRNQASVSWPRLAKQAAAALLAIGIPTTALDRQAIAQQSKAAPPSSTAGQDQAKCSMTGTITDPAGSVIPRAEVTITNVDTGVVRTVRSDERGIYAANGLASGHYTVKVQVAGFKLATRTGLVLQAGASERIDVSLGLEIGICEYVAISEVPHIAEANLIQRKKPFEYVVEPNWDHGTLQGIATRVYGDPAAWIQIFEANRSTIKMPGPLSQGTAITIPPRKRNIPQLISKVTPVYPASAKGKVWGDVLLDVTLKVDGTVEEAGVIDGDPLLVEAAVIAVKQWRYRPLLVGGKPVLKFVVAISFAKGGKVR